MSDRQADLIEQFVSGCRDYSERLTKDKDEKISYLQFRIGDLEELLSNRQRTLEGNANVIGKQNVTIINLNNQLGNLKENFQASQEQASESMHKNSFLCDIVKALSNERGQWRKKSETQQEELYRLRGLLDVLRSEKVAFTPEVSPEIKGLNIVNQGLRDKLKACGRKNVILTTANSNLRDARESAESVNRNVNAIVASLRRERDALKEEIQNKCKVIQRHITTHENDKDKEGSLSLEVNHRLNDKIVSLMAERDALKRELKEVKDIHSCHRIDNLLKELCSIKKEMKILRGW